MIMEMRTIMIVPKVIKVESSGLGEMACSKKYPAIPGMPQIKRTPPSFKNPLTTSMIKNNGKFS